jgi:hypothetical protein
MKGRVKMGSCTSKSVLPETSFRRKGNYNDKIAFDFAKKFQNTHVLDILMDTRELLTTYRGESFKRSIIV